MKIRSDFVTNSSSVSFIITMHPEIVHIREEELRDYWSKHNKSLLLVHDLLKEKLLNDGTRVMLEDEEIYTCKLKFQTDETMSADAYGRPHEEIDLTAMSDEEVWQYIYGEFIGNGRISALRGFGATQVETY